MSADNWMKCPKCLQKNTEDRENAIKNAKAKYGKIPEDEYREAIMQSEKPVVLKDSFREDYEQGMDCDGEYSVSYSGRCIVCGFCHV